MLGNQRGSALVISLVGVVVGAIVVFSIANIKAKQVQLSADIHVPVSAQILKSKIHGSLMNEANLKQTIRCHLKLDADCVHHQVSGGPSADPNSIVLYDKDKNLILDSRQENIGFNLSGEKCDQFNSNQGNDSCPFRYELKFSEPPQVSPLVYKIEGKMLYKPKTRRVLNSEGYQFQFSNLTDFIQIKNAIQICQSFGNADFDKKKFETKQASCMAFVKSCSGGLMSFNSQGLPECQNVVALATPPVCSRFMGYHSTTGVPLCN